MIMTSNSSTVLTDQRQINFTNIVIYSKENNILNAL